MLPRASEARNKDRVLLCVGHSWDLIPGEAETEDHLEASLVYIVSLGKPGLQSKFLFQKIKRQAKPNKPFFFWKSPKEKSQENVVSLTGQSW